jgi:hypothetical protein
MPPWQKPVAEANFFPAMSVLDRSRYFEGLPATSGLPRSTGIVGSTRVVRFCQQRNAA